MNRRQLLIRLGQTALAVAILPGARLVAAAPRHVSFDGKLFRGTSGGEILQSTDNGRAWQRAAFFGADRPVLNLAAQGASLHAQIGVDRFSFALQSADGRQWHTADAVWQG